MTNNAFKVKNGKLVQFRGRKWNYELFDADGEICGSFSTWDTRGVTEVTVPGNIQHVDFKAFGDCTDLKTIVLSEGIKSVELGAFWGADQLTDLYIPHRSLRSFSADSLPVKSEKVTLHVDYVQGGWKALQKAGFVLKRLPKELFEQHSGLFIALKAAYKKIAKLNLHVRSDLCDYEFVGMPIDCTVTFHSDIKSKYLFQRSMPSQIVIEKGVSYIDPDSFLSGGQFFLDDTNIEHISVKNNDYFYDVDGVLFGKNHSGRKLLRFPQARILTNNAYNIPCACTVAAGAFAGSIGIESLYIPAGTVLEQDALAAVPKLDKVFRETGG